MSAYIFNRSTGDSDAQPDSDRFEDLAELALNLRWTWNHEADHLWHEMEPELWDATQNPWVVLQTVSRDRLRSLLAQPAFRANFDLHLSQVKTFDTQVRWFAEKYPSSALKTVAYFSMEYMLSEALPIYSGGLGNVAGDQLKACSDLGIPIVGVGLLYQQGYFRQVIDERGAQQALYPYNDTGELPITPLRTKDGEWLRIEIDLPSGTIRLRTWQVQVGRVKLYLLDTNDSSNMPALRQIGGQLYGGTSEMRLQQEIILGIGGWRLLQAIGITPEVCHLNEGHAAFATLERARSFMKASGQPFHVALAATRPGNLFTTHTAVEAGFDRFTPTLIDKYFGKYATVDLGISMFEFLSLGRRNQYDSTELFNMAYLATRGSGQVNGVSKLHGEVSRELFSAIYPRWPLDEVPVGSVTNGIHAPTWDSPESNALWAETCGQERWLKPTESMGDCVRKLTDIQLWEFRNKQRRTLVAYADRVLANELAGASASKAMPADIRDRLNPEALTLGFARRFATYKRPNLLLQDKNRLLRILNSPNRPVQLIIAGKAHPADYPGQELVKQWIHFIRETTPRPPIIFLADYDMEMAARLVQGVNVWVNTPRRPWEACGTSGMKTLVNGGINLSELDGWWAEAFAEDIGWALGDGQEHDNTSAWDIAEADALYTVLEQKVVPSFYNRNDQGIPIDWTTMMRESMARLTPIYSANRCVREYTESHYLPAATEYVKRTAQKGAVGAEINEWQNVLKEKWSSLAFDGVKVQTEGNQHTFQVTVYLNDLDPNLIKVELCAMGVNGGPAFRQALERVKARKGNGGPTLFVGNVSASRPAEDYTPRLIASFSGAAVPLEAPWILWQR